MGSFLWKFMKILFSRNLRAVCMYKMTIFYAPDFSKSDASYSLWFKSYTITLKTENNKNKF